MAKKPINQVLAEALRYFMGNRWNNTTLGNAAGVAPNTVKNYLAPDSRDVGKTGKEPSAKLTELAKLAATLGLEVADLVTDATDAEREAIYRRRAADFYVLHGKMPPWAPPSPPRAERREELDLVGLGGLLEITGKKVEQRPRKPVPKKRDAKPGNGR